MTIDEAIERNTNIQVGFLPLPRHREWKAVQLGIEALKRVKNMRTSPCTTADEVLPGETE